MWNLNCFQVLHLNVAKSTYLKFSTLIGCGAFQMRVNVFVCQCALSFSGAEWSAFQFRCLEFQDYLIDVEYYFYLSLTFFYFCLRIFSVLLFFIFVFCVDYILANNNWIAKGNIENKKDAVKSSQRACYNNGRRIGVFHTANNHWQTTIRPGKMTCIAHAVVFR